MHSAIWFCKCKLSCAVPASVIPDWLVSYANPPPTKPWAFPPLPDSSKTTYLQKPTCLQCLFVWSLCVVVRFCLPWTYVLYPKQHAMLCIAELNCRIAAAGLIFHHLYKFSFEIVLWMKLSQWVSIMVPGNASSEATGLPFIFPSVRDRVVPQLCAYVLSGRCISGSETLRLVDMRYQITLPM